MKEMILLLGGIAPLELLIQQMEEAVISAKAELVLGKEELSDQTKSKLGLACALMISRISTDGSPEKTMKLMKEMELSQRGRDMIKPSEQNKHIENESKKS